MNVLFITNWYPHEEDPNFGAFIIAHAKAVMTAGHQLVLLHIHTESSSKLYVNKTEDFIDENNIRVFRITILSRFWKIFRMLADYQFQLSFRILKKTLFKTFIPDIIHSNVIFTAGIIGHRITQRLKKPHIITEHWSDLDNFFKRNIYSKEGRHAYRTAKFVLPVSSFMEEYIKGFTGKDVQFRVIPNIIDPNIFRYHPKDQLDPRRIRFISVARWTETKTQIKRPDLIMDALAILCQESEIKYELEIIGEGNMLLAMQAKAEDLGINVKFAGLVEKPYIANALNHAHFLLHASNIETFSLVVAEALVTGTPVIASNVGGVPDLIDDNNGILCENTVEAWVVAIKTGIQKQYDYEKIANLNRNKYSFESVGRNITEVYLQAINQTTDSHD